MRDDLRAFRTLSGKETDGARGSSDARRAKMRALLKRAVVSELTARQAECFLLYFGEGMTMQAVADALGTTRSGVSKHIARGIARLRRALRYAVKF